MELRLETIYSPFSSDCNEFKSSYFDDYKKNNFILEHPNYNHRQRLFFFWTTFGALFDGVINFFPKSHQKVVGLTYFN